jgi:integrase
MAKVTFNLKKPKSESKTLILAMFRFYDYVIPLSTGEQIIPTKWNFENCRPKPSRIDARAKNLTYKLNDIEKKMQKAYDDHYEKYKRIIVAELKNELRTIARPTVEESKKEKTLIEIAEEYVKLCNKKYLTIKKYNTGINHLKEYEKSLKSTIYPEDITMVFYYAFTKWLEKQHKSKNTIGSQIKEIKVFMNYANDRGYSNATAHMNKRFVVLKEESDSIYLTEEEILKIYNLELKEEYKLNIRDAFIIACYTGLRYSDLAQLGPDKFVDNGTKIKIKTIKTGENVIIPLHWTIMEILKRRDGVFPKIYSDQFFNREIKLLAEKATITDLVSKSITRGGKHESKSFNKDKLVTVHTARRSFATNAFKAGVPPYSIMKITGHKTERAFRMYIKIDSEQSAGLVENHSFFTKQENNVVEKNGQIDHQ